MYLSKRIAGRFFLLALVIMLAACSPAAPTKNEPTVDPNMIYTAAAKTVQAQLTKEAAQKPSPTATEEPTATLSIPTADTSSFPTLAVPGSAAATIPALTSQPGAQPISTLTPMGAQTGVKPATAGPIAKWISNDPPDGSVLDAGTKIDIYWTVKNTGTTTWTKDYYYAYFSGDKIIEKSRYNLTETVAPGKEIRLVGDLNVPTKSGKYFTWWKVVNDQGQNIGDIDLTIVVVQAGETPATVTPTP